MTTANQLLDELLLHVEPPRGISIALTERSPEASGEPNWTAGARVMDIPACNRFSAKVDALRKSDPIVDWADVTAVESSQRRVAKWRSEVGKAK